MSVLVRIYTTDPTAASTKALASDYNATVVSTTVFVKQPSGSGNIALRSPLKLTTVARALVGDVGAYVETGAASTLTLVRGAAVLTLSGAAGALTLTGAASTLTLVRGAARHLTLSGAAGALTLTGAASFSKKGKSFPTSGVNIFITDPAAVSALTLASDYNGTVVSTNIYTKQPSGSGNIAISSPLITAGPRKAAIAGAVGALTLTGVAVTAKTVRKLANSVGALTLTGSAIVKANRKTVGAIGALTLTGAASTLTKISGHTLLAAAGALTLTGAASTSKIGRKAASSTGVLALTGAAQVSSHRNIVFATGVESLTGKASAPTVNRKFVLPSLTPVVTVVS